MAQINVTHFAKELGLPIELLIEQLQTAGVKKKLADDTVLTEKDKTQLLDYLRQAHAAKEAKNKIVLTRKQATEIKKSDGTGKARTIQVEVRRKRVLVKRDAVVEVPKVLLDAEQVAVSEVEVNQTTEISTFNDNSTTVEFFQKGLTELPIRLLQSRNLEEIEAAHNALDSLPNWISQLNKLRVLNLSHNRIMRLPDEFRDWGLQELNLAENNIDFLPPSIGDLKRLQILNLSGNRLAHLPKELGQLRNLRILNLAANQLTELPDFVRQLSKLEILIVGDNQLATLPNAVGTLMSLLMLNATGNRLTNLPRSLRNLSSLEGLFLHNNPGLELPPEVVGPSYSQIKMVGATLKPANPSDILEYFFSSRRGSRPLNEAKMILVGRGGAGKTSIVNRLVNATFNGTQPKTEGIAIVPWSMKASSDDAVRLNIWDFGGQEIMHATHQFFLTKRSLYVLVLNAREGEQDSNVEYWLRMIESFGGDSPVIVVMNKIKDHAFDLNRRGLRGKFSSIQEFVQTDCEENIGIDHLEAAIARETAKLPHLRDPFPISWFAVKDELTNSEHNFVSYEQYQRLCVEHDVTEESSQSTLVGFLHDLGTVVNFRDHPRLRDTHVLNPHWVTNGIYKILNARSFVERRTGEVRINELSQLLNLEDYPQDKHQFLLALMEKFELCYESYDEPGLYLIPELLTKEEPRMAGVFDTPDLLQFEYHYNILPEGLLPRFIVRSRALNKDLLRWRTGVALWFERNHALVRADIQDRKLSIAVSGNPSGRQRLLSIIRSDLERIHGSIARLQAREMVPLPGQNDVVLPYAKLKTLEASGFSHVPEVVGDEVIDVDITGLLDGIETIEERWRTSTPDGKEGKMAPIQVAYSYSHKDEELRDQLETHLKLLQRNRVISTWHDRKITAGDTWVDVIDANFRRADLILLLVSADFISSDYCYEIEVKTALERHGKNEARVVPIIVRPCAWQKSLFSKLQALPRDGKAITSWGNRDEAWLNVTQGIEDAVAEIQKKRSI